MDEKNGIILSAEEEQRLLAPINEYVGSIQEKVNALRLDGTDRVVALNTHMAVVKENANYTKKEQAEILSADRAALEKAKAVEAANRSEIRSLVDDATAYLTAHYDREYYDKVVASCSAQTAEENRRYSAELVELRKEHEAELRRLKDPGEIKDENTSIKTVSLTLSSSMDPRCRRSRTVSMRHLPTAITCWINCVCPTSRLPKSRSRNGKPTDIPSTRNSSC